MIVALKRACKIIATLETTHRVYKKDDLECYKYFYNSSGDSFIYSEKEQEEIYNLVDSILTNKYSLLVASLNLWTDIEVVLSWAKTKQL